MKSSFVSRAPHAEDGGGEYRPCRPAWQASFTVRSSAAIDDCPVRGLRSSKGQLASGFPPGTDAEGLYKVLSPHEEEAPAPFTAAAAYSSRSPLMGSNAAAYRAGRKLASCVTAPRMSVTTPYTRKSALRRSHQTPLDIPRTRRPAIRHSARSRSNTRSTPCWPNAARL